MTVGVCNLSLYLVIKLFSHSGEATPKPLWETHGVLNSRLKCVFSFALSQKADQYIILEAAMRTVCQFLAVLDFIFSSSEILTDKCDFKYPDLSSKVLVVGKYILMSLKSVVLYQVVGHNLSLGRNR